MTKKNEKLPTIKIKGKDYVQVKDRILYFNEAYPNGRIRTEIVKNDEDVVVRAKVTPDVDKPERCFEDFAQETWGDGFINKTSALENASTSAVGRALALMGIGVIESIASADEVVKANKRQSNGDANKGKKISASQAKLAHTIVTKASEYSDRISEDSVKKYYNIESFKDLTKAQLDELVKGCNKAIKESVNEEFSKMSDSYEETA